jgi:hypothetical protein
LSTVLEGREGSASRPGRSLSPGTIRYSSYRRLGGPQGRSGHLLGNSTQIHHKRTKRTKDYYFDSPVGKSGSKKTLHKRQQQYLESNSLYIETA